MSLNRINPKAGFVFGKRDGKCRKCGKDTPSNRRTFCSKGCVHEWKLTTDPTYVRRCVLERDKGVCKRCGLNTIALAGAFDLFVGWAGDFCLVQENLSPDFIEAAKLIGAARRKLSVGHRESLWDADHIVEVVNGGGECGIENYQTLCVWCHRAKKVVKLDASKGGPQGDLACYEQNPESVKAQNSHSDGVKR